MHQVLLLNMGYEPLRIIGWRRALGLILRERVDPASADGVTIQGVSTALHIPYVLRLKYYVNVPASDAQWTRRGVLCRDRYTCIYCGVQPGERHYGTVLTRRDMTVDHILPLSRGGKSTWVNTACACRACNQYKANCTPAEVRLCLRWMPEAPRMTFWELSGDVPAVWKTYLETGSI
ncbi:MAG: HNH endonuclease [Anaerolineae bacterium]|nr:HNH endonuclease [Anaerolineae bacterium]